MIRKLLMLGAAVALPLGLVTTFGFPSAGASTPPVVAAGTVNCTTLSGKIAFSPPLTTSGGSSTETATVGVKLSGCTPSVTSDLGTGFIITGKATATISTNKPNANACSSLGSSQPQTQTVKWKDKNASGVTLAKLAPTVVTFSGFDVVAGAGGTAGFDLPQDSGGTASIASGGSFAGTDHGATSDANAFTVDTEAQIASLCGSSTGVAKLKLGGAGDWHGSVAHIQRVVAPAEPPETHRCKGGVSCPFFPRPCRAFRSTVVEVHAVSTVE